MVHLQAFWKLESAFNGFQRIAGRWWHILSLNAARGHVVGGGSNLGAAKVVLLGFFAQRLL